MAETRSIWPIAAADIARIVGGAVAGDAGAVAARLCLDTRAGVGAGDLFVALRGPNHDGARFAGHALAHGASVVVLEQGAAVGDPPPGRAVVVVASALAALQALAREARHRFGGTVVAITGSTGKTITKDALHRALGAAFPTWASPGSWNSQVGVAAALLDIDPHATYAIVECGVSEAGEMARLADIVAPDVGVFTNVGDTHLAGFGTRERIAFEKAALFAGPRCRAVFVPENEALALLALRAANAHVRPVTIATGRVCVDEACVESPRIRPDDPIACDFALAVAVAVALGVQGDAALEALASWRAPSMRLELTETPRGVTLINDSYVSDPQSADAALRVLARERAAGRTVAVLGGFAQLGAARRSAHATLGTRAATTGVDILVAVGEYADEIAGPARDAGCGTVYTVRDVDEAGRLVADLARAGDRVLLKASRPERLERVVEALSEGLAPTRLVIDLDRVRGNLAAIATAAAPAGVMPIVKAFGYGIDAVRLGRSLEAAGAVAFGVAYPDEGIALRDNGVRLPILVQNVVPSEVHKVVRHGLSVAVGDVAAVERLEAAAALAGTTCAVHLKVDTGMGRSGAEVRDVSTLAARIVASPHLRAEGLMTHLASAEDPAADTHTNEQLDRFDEAILLASAASFVPRWIHAANSSAVARHPRARYSLVRTGIGLLGYAERAESVGTRPALRLVTQVIACRDVPPGRGVGYGSTWVAGPGGARIATVAIGYADGLLRALSNRGSMTIHGVRVPIVGRICMDVTMLDVSGVPDDIAPGTEVVVFGHGDNEVRVDEAAALAGTISYELLTRISPRVRRIFVGEG